MKTGKGPYHCASYYYLPIPINCNILYYMCMHISVQYNKSMINIVVVFRNKTGSFQIYVLICSSHGKSQNNYHIYFVLAHQIGFHNYRPV